VAGNLIPWQQGRPSWPTWDPAIATKESYARLALIYRCMNLIAHAVGTATMRVYLEATEEEVPDHALRLLMRRPNPTMGESVFHGMVALKAMTSGFCVVEKERSRDGEVIALWPLQSDWLTAVKRPDLTFDWRYQVPGIRDPFPLASEDVIHFRWSETPNGSAYGMGPLEACLREVGLTNAMVDFLKAFFDHGAVPLIGLIPDLMPGQTLSQAKQDALLGAFMERHGGLSGAADPALLTGIKDVKRLGFDMNELAYVDLRDLSELAITQAFGIPASVAPLRVGLEHSDSRANAESDEGKFYRQAVVPFWSRWDDTLSISLLEREYPDAARVNLAFDWSDVPAMQEDRNAKAAWTIPAVMGGIMSVHAWHREMNLKPPQGADYYVRNFAQVMVPVTDPLMLTVEPTIPDAPPAEGQAALTPPARMAALGTGRMVGRGPAARMAAAGKARGSMEKVTRAGQIRLQKFFAAQAKRIIPTAMKGLLESQRDLERLAWAVKQDPMYAIYSHAARRLALEEAPETSALERLLSEPRFETLAAAFSALLEGIDRMAVSDIDWDAENARISKDVRAVHMAAGKASFTDGKALYGIDAGIAFDVANPAVKRVVDKMGKKIKDITETTRKDVTAKIAAGLDKGLTSKEIAGSLETMFEQTYKNRAWTVARTETTHAYGYANEVLFKESGVVDRAQLFDNPDHDEDYGASDGLTCAERDGFVCPLDEMMDHILADHPNGSVVGTPILEGEDSEPGDE
jgi:HK97 family phage portal protein